MGTYGLGQGLAQGVHQAGNFLLQAKQLKQQKDQFDALQGIRQQYADAYKRSSRLKSFGSSEAWDPAVLSQYMMSESRPTGQLQGERLGAGIPQLGMSPAAALVNR